MAPPSLSSARAVATALAVMVAALGLVELGLRGLRGGHAALPIYASLTPPSLLPGVRTIGLLGDIAYPVEIDSRGLRAPSAASGTLLLGDSLAFGLGLPGDQTLAARCTALGRPMLNGAAPGFSAVDAVARGDALTGLATDFVLVLNPWDDDATALGERAQVVNGWLLRRDAPGWMVGFFDSPFASWQLPHDAVAIAAMLSPTSDSRLGFAAVGARIGEFVARHPATQVVWGGYPTAAMPDGRDVATLRAEVGVPMIDLDLHDAWLGADLHWSAEGVEQVAGQLCGSTGPAPPPNPFPTAPGTSEADPHR